MSSGWPYRSLDVKTTSRALFMSLSLQSHNLPSLLEVMDRSPLTVSSTTSVAEAIGLMSQAQGKNCVLPTWKNTLPQELVYLHQNSCVLITEGNQLRGILTERDIVSLAAAQRDLSNTLVSEVMTQQLVTLTQSPSQTALTALSLFYQHRIRHLPIVDDRGQLLGLITPNVIRQILQPVNLLKLRLIEEVMTGEVIQAPATASVLSIAQQMTAHRVSCVVIVEEVPTGIITERDIVQFQTMGIDLARTQAQAVMSSPVFCLQPQDSLWQAHQEMQTRGIRRLVVTDSSAKMLGLITQSSLVQRLDPVEMLGLLDILQHQVQTQTSALEQTNLELQQIRQQLEQQVALRTAELFDRNQQLQQEIQQHQQTEEALIRSQRDLRDFVDNAVVGLHWVDKDGTILWANQAELDLLGYTASEYIGHSITEFHVDQDLIADILQRLLSNQPIQNYEAPLRCKDGSTCLVSIDSSSSWKDGNFSHTRCFTRDISDRKRTEVALQDTLRSLEFQKYALDQSAIVAITDRAGTILSVNEQFCHISQYTAAELIGENHRIINSGYHPPEFFRELWHTIASGQVWRGEICNRAKDGHLYWVATTIVPFLDEQGTPFQYLAIRFDISERVRAEAARKVVEDALRHSEQKFRAIFDGTFQFVGLLDTNGVLLEGNRTALNAIGVTSEQVIGQLFWETPWWTHSPDLQIQLQQAIRQAASGQLVRFEAKHFLADGSYITVDFSLSPIFDETGKVVMLIPEGRDISERKAAEQKIREQAMLLNISTDAILVRDLEHHIRFWNHGAERIYGWSDMEAIGQDIKTLLYRDFLLDAALAFDTVVQTGEWQGELQKITKTGQQVVVQSRWTLVRDELGNPKEILSVDTDITEKKQLEAQFLRTQRLESLGTLASGIAHDMNNILTPILAAAQLLPLKLTNLDERSTSLLRMLEESARRGSNLVQQILSFARGSDGSRSSVQIAHILAEVIRVARQTFPKSIHISINLPDTELQLITADGTQLHQVLMNLLINARDAMPNGGDLQITAENLVLDETYAPLNVNAKAGSYVMITVADNGTGIPPEILDRIFEPFFTTKESGKGTGLGLSTTLGIVKSHGGFVNAYSDVGRGTCFKIYLPAAAGPEAAGRIGSLELPLGNGELILVVDDEISVREITKASLETYNYRVLMASDGVEAIALYAQYQAEVQFILLDLMMPSLDSASTIRALRQINSDVSIVVMSGLSANEPIKNMRDVNVQAFLAKPFTSQELLQTLQRLKSA
jgi:PAS domain S-box-containing protein